MKKRILFEVGHPKHVHQFHQIYCDLIKEGGEGLFAAKDKDIVIDLLKDLNVPYKVFAKTPEGLINKILSIPGMDFSLLKIVNSFNPDILLSRVSVHSGHVGFLRGIPHIGFSDTESAKKLDLIAAPFTNRILTSHSFQRSYGRKQIRYPGYIELWYLHPDRFTPDPEIYGFLGISPHERFVILRFISWKAHHDVGFKGFDNAKKFELVNAFSKYAKVFVSSENELPPELQPYKIHIPVKWVHHALYYADLFYGESSTMATESAMLGTPSIFLYPGKVGYTEDLEKRFNLLHNFSLTQDDQDRSIALALKILENTGIKKTYSENRDKMLSFCINPVSFISWYVQNYPQSDHQVKADPEFINRFR